MDNLSESNVNTTTALDELQQLLADVSAKSRHVLGQLIQKPVGLSDALPHMRYLTELYQKFTDALIAHPSQLLEAQLSYWQDCLRLWRHSAATFAGISIPEKPSINMPTDRRFQNELWDQSPYFNFIKHFYFLTAQHIQTSIKKIDGIEEPVAKKIEFYTQQFIDALSPTNFILTNPDVLQKTMRTRGKNLLQGFKNMLSDLEKNKGMLNIKMVDLAAFEIGRNVATTPGKVIFQNELIQLIQYTPTTAQVYKKPLLIVPPWINKYFILDLSQENSLAKWLVDQGYTVFMISWLNPDEKQAHIDFEDYMTLGPIAACEAIEQATGEPQVNTLGFCIGGTLLGCTLAYLSAKKKQRITSATYLNTLFDFSEPGELGTFIDEKQIALLEQLMAAKGYFEGKTMALAFNTLRANDLIWSYFVRNYLNGEEPFPFDILYWNALSTNMPAKMHSTYLRATYLNNLLAQPGKLKLHNVPIDLGKITCPIYCLATEQDHITPWKSVYSGARLHAGPVEFVLGHSGHIAGVVNPPHKNKYGYYTQETGSAFQNADTWQSNIIENQGSWWSHWHFWLQKHSSNLMNSSNRIPGQGGLPSIEDAPGSYVKK